MNYHKAERKEQISSSHVPANTGSALKQAEKAVRTWVATSNFQLKYSSVLVEFWRK